MLIEGSSGVVVYGEIATWVTVGWKLNAGEPIGHVKTVLKTDKGRPMSMLHIELHEHGARDAPAWEGTKPATLLDPTKHLLRIFGTHDECVGVTNDEIFDALVRKPEHV